MLKINADNISSLIDSVYNFKSLYNDSVIIDTNIVLLMPNQAELDTHNFFNFFSIDSLYELSSLKNNVDELVKIFPSMEDDIELLDL